MGGSKCSRCGLVNMASDDSCRRCGEEFAAVAWKSSRRVGPRDRAKLSSPLWPLLALTIIGAAIYYVFSGAEKSIESVGTTTPGTPIAVQRQSQPDAYKSAVQNSNGLSQGQKHTAEIEKLTQSPK